MLKIAVRGVATPTAVPSVVTITGGSAVAEGTAAEFTVAAEPAPAANLTVNLTVSESSGSDYVASGDEGAQTVTIAAGSTSATYEVATQCPTRRTSRTAP